MRQLVEAQRLLETASRPSNQVAPEIDKGGLAKVRTELAKGGFESLWENPGLSNDCHEV
jgi:hypothetical protein